MKHFLPKTFFYFVYKKYLIFFLLLLFIKNLQDPSMTVTHMNLPFISSNFSINNTINNNFKNFIDTLTYHNLQPIFFVSNKSLNVTSFLFEIFG